MGCLSFILRRIGGITSSLTRIDGGITTEFSHGGGIESSFSRVGGIASSFRKVGGIQSRMGLVCKPNIMRPYLEIAPEIIWVYPDWAVDNNVYSNTHWNVD